VPQSGSGVHFVVEVPMGRKGRWAAAAGAAVLAGAVVRRRLHRFAVVEASMRPTLEPGDWLVAQRRTAPPRRGDIVVFEHPEVPGFWVVKRVVGLPGERVEVAGGQVHVDGAILAEPWAEGPTLPEGTWEVPRDAVWVLGDQRALSAADSRTLGPLPLVRVPWKVVARYWPLERAGLL